MFQTWDHVVGMSVRLCILVIGRFLTPRAVLMYNIGSFQGLYLGGGSILGTSDWGWLVFGITLGSSCGAVYSGRSTLRTHCSSLVEVGAAGSAVTSGYPWYVVHQKILEIIFRDAVCLYPRGAGRVGVAECLDKVCSRYGRSVGWGGLRNFYTTWGKLDSISKSLDLFDHI